MAMRPQLVPEFQFRVRQAFRMRQGVGASLGETDELCGCADRFTASTPKS